MPELLDLRCAGCGKPSLNPIPPIAWQTEDGWEVEWPRCGCGKFLLCPDCADVVNKCPSCGCGEFYT